MVGERRGPLRERRFDTGAVEINFAEGPPNGPPFVVLHGGSARWQYGEALLWALTDRWHVYAPDFRGHGKSDRSPGRYQVRDYAADLVAFLTHMASEPAVLSGHSLGGFVALLTAAEYPDLVRAVIEGDADLGIQSHPMEQPVHKAQNILWHGLAGRPVAEIAVALQDTPVAAPGEASPRRAAEVFGEDSPWFAFQAISLHQLDPDVLAAALAGPAYLLEGLEPLTTLPAITCPVLLLQADPAAGGMWRDDDVREALRLLPRATHVRLTGIGHELHGPSRQTSLVIEAITPFLDGLRALENERRSDAGSFGR